MVRFVVQPRQRERRHVGDQSQVAPPAETGPEQKRESRAGASERAQGGAGRGARQSVRITESERTVSGGCVPVPRPRQRVVASERRFACEKVNKTFSDF